MRGSVAGGIAAAVVAALLPAGAAAQGEAPPAPPPAGFVASPRAYALGAAVGSLEWDDPAPYDDLFVAGLAVERRLWPGVRGRAAIAAGSTELLAVSPAVDVWVMTFDLQVVLAPELGPFRAIGVVPYGVAGVGSLVTNPTGDGADDLPTRSQSQLTYGGGVRVRLGERWEASGEGTVGRVRLADPIEAEERESDPIHNTRWEGRLSWLF